MKDEVTAEPDPASITVDRDLVYLDEDRSERLDLYRPRRRDAGRTAGIVFIHGGSFHAGDKASPRSTGLCRMLAANGFVVASVNYRLSAGPTGEDRWTAWPRNLEDCRAAAEFLIRRADDFGVDPARVGAVGTSAGGTLALLIAFQRPEQLRAVVNFYGRVDPSLHTVPEKRPNSVEVMEAVSPIRHMGVHLPAVLTIHGDADELVPVEHGKLLHAELSRRRATHRLVVIPRVGHGFGAELEPVETRRTIIEFLNRQLAEESGRAGS